jgi:hypothetical protein
MVNQNLSQQLLAKGGDKHNLGNPNPFAGDGEELASVGYRCVCLGGGGVGSGEGAGSTCRGARGPGVLCVLVHGLCAGTPGVGGWGAAQPGGTQLFCW